MPSFTADEPCCCGGCCDDGICCFGDGATIHGTYTSTLKQFDMGDYDCTPDCSGPTDGISSHTLVLSWDFIAVRNVNPLDPCCYFFTGFDGGGIAVVFPAGLSVTVDGMPVDPASFFISLELSYNCECPGQWYVNVGFSMSGPKIVSASCFKNYDFDQCNHDPPDNPNDKSPTDHRSKTCVNGDCAGIYYTECTQACGMDENFGTWVAKTQTDTIEGTVENNHCCRDGDGNCIAGAGGGSGDCEDPPP